jgi:6-pyruvoyltetrahydropterin/6-carboxytetrahydropterin synthase
MYEITTEASFSAAHHLNNYDGPCEKVHGHNWLVRATARCGKLDSAGIGIDFKTLRSKIKEVLAELDHTDLNVPLGRVGLNPSSENLAFYIFGRLRDRLKGMPCTIRRVEVFETPGNSAAYFEEE